jgi:predicted DNA-binding transcriptional regulator AlpA
MAELLSIDQVCKLTGLARATIKSHRRRPVPGRAPKVPFPEPAMRFSGVPVWSRESVERWLEERDTKPGRAKRNEER